MKILSLTLTAIVFSVPATIASAQSRVRCGVPDRDLRQNSTFWTQPSDCSYSSTSIQPEYEPSFLYDIPVVFHVIQDTGGTGYLSSATVQDQIDVLNEDFQALAGSPGAPGLNTRIRFHLATEDPTGSPTTGITYTTNDTWFQDQGNYWGPLSWDTNRYLNIYANANPGYYGYAYVPQQGGVVGWTGDRIVLWWEAVGRYGTAGWPGNMGRTGTHEVGHYLGLFHTFDGGCASSSNCYGTGDLICDTNPQENYTWGGCPSPNTSCGSVDQTQNYMDYTDDLCLWEFTPEQANRMRCTIQHWRMDLPVVCNIGYGQGCSGSSGITPTLFVDGCALPEAQIEITIANGMGGAQAFLLLGLNQGAAGMGGGCTLNVSPLLPLIVGPLPLSGQGAGAGSILFNATIPATAAPGTFTMQAFVSDPGGVLGFSNTPGVSVTIL